MFWLCKHMHVYSILETAGYWKIHEAHPLMYGESTKSSNLSFRLLLLLWGSHSCHPREWNPQVASSFFGPLPLTHPSRLTSKKPRCFLKRLHMEVLPSVDHGGQKSLTTSLSGETSPLIRSNHIHPCLNHQRHIPRVTNRPETSLLYHQDHTNSWTCTPDIIERRETWDRNSWEGVVVTHCCVTNYPTFRGLKQQYLFIASYSFCESEISESQWQLPGGFPALEDPSGRHLLSKPVLTVDKEARFLELLHIFVTWQLSSCRESDAKKQGESKSVSVPEVPHHDSCHTLQLAQTTLMLTKARLVVHHLES